MEPFKEGEWVVLHQLNKKKLARIGQKGFTSLGKDFVSLEGAIGCLPWTNFKMELQTGAKSSKRTFKIVPFGDDDDDYSELYPHDLGQGDEDEDRDNRTINDDGQSQGLTAIEIEALREGGLTGKEIVNHLVANSTTYDKKTRYAKSKYVKKKESKHCLREKLSIRRTTLSSVAEVLCSGGGGEGSRGSISGMRPDTLSQMLTALNIQWKRIMNCKNNESERAIFNVESGSGGVESIEKKDSDLVSLEVEKVSEVGTMKNAEIPKLGINSQPGTTYVVYESGNWGLLVASLLTLLPSVGPRLIHLYPGHGVPCLIAPRALNLPQEKLSILSSVNFKALLEKLKIRSGNVIGMDEVAVKMEITEDQFSDCEVNSEIQVDGVSNVTQVGASVTQEENNVGEVIQEVSSNEDVLSETNNKNRKRKMEGGEATHGNESSCKKPRWQLEAECAASLLTSRKADGLVVVAVREHPVSIVLTLLPYLAPSRPLVVYCPHREPLLDLYAVLKGWEPWTTKYVRNGSKEGIPRVANLRVVENWLRNYQILQNRTHPKINMTPGGGFVLTGTVIDFRDD